MKRRLSAKFDQAMRFAIKAHDGQFRKGSGAPYVSHPMAVASLVMEYGGSEAQVVAALLHDVIEDCGVSHAQLERRFGARAARIVAECSDYFGPKGGRKPAWRGRKENYIAHLAHVDQDTLLVSASDKLHNARSIVHDVLHFGPKTWTRFSAPPEDISWYYRSLLKAYRKRAGSQHPVLLFELENAVRQLSTLAKRAV